MNRLNPNRPKTPDALALVPAWHAECKAKGHDPLHALMEDGNYGDAHCVVKTPGMPASKALGDMLLQMSKSQRARVASRHFELVR